MILNKISRWNVRHFQGYSQRLYRVLAIESSCDDSCVALLDKFLTSEPPKVIDHVKLTLESAHIGGIMPTAAHDFHNESIAQLISDFLKKHRINSECPPELICCTQGPGMVGSLTSSLQVAKGISLAWNVPLIGVHHMLGHILVSQLPKQEQPNLRPPNYPFLSLSCSGGHTMLVLSKSISNHEIIIDVCDIAAGDSIDKCARELGLRGNLLGKELEKFVDKIPQSIKDEFNKINTNTNDNEFEFLLKLPLKGPKNPRIPDSIEFSFASFLSRIQSYLSKNHEIDERKKQFLAYKVQNVVFDHIIDRVNVALKKHGNNKDIYNLADGKFNGMTDFICSGGVAANKVLRKKLANNLISQETLNTNFTFHFPDLALCTDNAVMIGVAGIEIFEKLRLKSDLKITPIRKWPLNELLSKTPWVNVSEEEFAAITKSKHNK